MDDIKRKCFFCSEKIDGKVSLEHIIPNSLLGTLGLKNEKLNGDISLEYSRIKVPSHGSCNNEFGSTYESKVLELLSEPQKLYEELRLANNGNEMMTGPCSSSVKIISTWMQKIHYGFLYNDLIKNTSVERKEIATSILNDSNFKLLQESYRMNLGFNLPSSLYVFKAKKNHFNLCNIISPQVLMIKIENLIFILCIADGHLAQNYLTGSVLEKLENYVDKEEIKNMAFPKEDYLLGEILALLNCIPKSSKFIIGNDQIINMSFSTMVSNPDEYYKIDEEKLDVVRKEIMESLGIII